MYLYRITFSSGFKHLVRATSPKQAYERIKHVGEISYIEWIKPIRL